MRTRVRELTARGRGSISVIEILGPGARNRIKSIASQLPGVGDICVTSLSVGEELLEDAVITSERDDHFELHLTGSPPLVRRVLRLLDGDFALPVDCVEARAEVALSEAASEMGARILLDQFNGALRSALEAHRTDSGSDWEVFATELLENARLAMPAIQPKRVALAGAVNAGKSTLFNLLVGTERVIVSDQPGTTRDAVVAKTQLGNWPVVLIDTAGEREFAENRGAAQTELLEQAGQKVGRLEREAADLVFWLGGSSAEAPIASKTAQVRSLISRADERIVSPADADRAFSSQAEPEAARELLLREFQAFFGLPDSAWAAGRPVPFETKVCAALRASLDRAVSEQELRRAAVYEALGAAPN